VDLLSSASAKGSGSCITLNAFLRFVSTVLKGDFDEKVGIVFSMCSARDSSSGPPNKTISGSSITQVELAAAWSHEFERCLFGSVIH